MRIRFDVDDSSTLEQLAALTPRQFMIAWTRAVRQFVQERARSRIGGDFGSRIARNSILIDDSEPERHEIYTGGENGYIAEHIHTGGVVRPKKKKYLAVPTEANSKPGKWPNEYPEKKLFLLKSKAGNLLLFQRPKKRMPLSAPLFVLKESVTHRPKPWWPSAEEVEGETIRFFNENF